jgi:glycosyltransferase involved in cell wall biosynthesis
VHKVLISNGFGHFHLREAAEIAAREGLLSGYVTGGYPSVGVLGTLSRLPYPPARRLHHRGAQIPKELVYALNIAEIFNQVCGTTLRLRALRSLHDDSIGAAMRLYQSRAWPNFRGLLRGSSIFHFRSGFAGTRAIEHARERGVLTVCDHSIAHPRLLKGLIAGKSMTDCLPERPRGYLNTLIDRDCESADVILVNSQFVKDTFVRCGVHADRVKIIYTLPDRDFLQTLPLNPERRPRSHLKVLFAGTVTERKGASMLAQVATQMGPSIEFTIAGQWDSAVSHLRRQLSALSWVRILGILDRPALANEMLTNHVLFLPTLAEGSARVVSEAMAAGCAILTTPNAGSLLNSEDVEQLTAPTDVDGLTLRLRQFAQDLEWCQEVGIHNRARLLDASSVSYAQRVAGLYRELCA